MRKILTLFLILSTILVFGANTYVATSANGGNDSNAGTIGSPWLTAKYGIEHTASGDTCIFGVGTFPISSYIFPPLGVSFMGVDSVSTIFSVTFTTSAAINAYWATVVNGGHYIANIKFEGNGTAHSAFNSTRRSNITFNKCSFHNFLSGGIYAYDGFDDLANSPALSNINVYNSQFVDCSKYLAAGSFGAIWHRGVKDYEILNTTVIANYLLGDSAGFLVKGSRIKNVRISNCTFMIYDHDDGAKWAFAMEYNHILGGIQIDNNRIQGVIDFAGNMCQKGVYPYSLWIHHNTLGHESLSARWHDGIYLENYALNSSMDMSDVIIEDNAFPYLTRAIVFMKDLGGIQSHFNRISIQRNIMTNIGRDASGANGWGITWAGSGGFFRDINIFNNTFVASTLATRSQLVAVNLPVRSSTTDVYKIINNIMVGFDNAPIFTDGGYPTGTIDSLYIQNNDMYQNGNSNDPKWWGVVPTNIFSTNNLKVDPLFVSTRDFRLQTLSPAIDAGLNIGLPYLYDAPDIGAYEYVIENPAVIGEIVLDNPQNVTTQGVTIFASATNDGGGTISERGIVWSTSANPTTSSYKINYGSGLGVFKVVLSGLKPSTKYYLRAYLINEAGTAYSNQVIVNTKYSSIMTGNGKTYQQKGFIIKMR
jgi:hypothetical protein